MRIVRKALLGNRSKFSRVRWVDVNSPYFPGALVYIYFNLPLENKLVPPPTPKKKKRRRQTTPNCDGDHLTDE